jgi:hypothetical protein
VLWLNTGSDFLSDVSLVPGAFMARQAHTNGNNGEADALTVQSSDLLQKSSLQTLIRPH